MPSAKVGNWCEEKYAVAESGAKYRHRVGEVDGGYE